jgi:hypothetical protein
MYGIEKNSMFGAPSIVRWVAPFVACALAIIWAIPTAAATIDLSLNVYYTNQSTGNSGGTWELFAKSSDFGISGVRTFITGINTLPPSQTLKAPRGTFDSGKPAGMSDIVFSDTFFPANNPTPAYHELIFGQLPQPNGSPQGAFYGIGTIINGHPGDVGPAIPTLADPQGIPWAANGDVFGDPAWNTGALLASGTFSVGSTPAFFTGDEPSSGQVFDGTAIGGGPLSGTVFGNAVNATINRIVRSNLNHSADYNRNGGVDAADYVMWRKTQGTTTVPGTGADGYIDGNINSLDYFWWRSRFGNASGSGAGLSAELSVSAVPEPASAVLFVVAALLAMAPRVTRKSADEQLNT